MNLNPAQDQFSTFHKLMHIVADAHMSHGSEYMSGWGGGEEFCGVRPFSAAVRSARSSVLKYSKASFRFNVAAPGDGRTPTSAEHTRIALLQSVRWLLAMTGHDRAHSVPMEPFLHCPASYPGIQRNSVQDYRRSQFRPDAGLETYPAAVLPSAGDPRWSK